jgi:hypothetical protein
MKTHQLLFLFLVAAANPLHAQTLVDALDAPQLTWMTGGDAAWFAQTAATHDGTDATRSGAIADDEHSWLETTVTGPGTLTFWWKVSSEGGYDYLALFTNEVFAEHVITGEIDWQQRTVVLGSGPHVLLWAYVKDENVSIGQDHGWLDEVVFTPTVVTQDVPLSIQRNNNQFVISWPAGLDLVQPEKASNLRADAWQNFGAPITAQTVSDASGDSAVFYRLRFLPPNITAGPASRTVLAGENVMFTVSAVGTAPMGYQWRRNGSPLNGQNASALNLSAVTLSDAGGYSVVITNRAGGATSGAAMLTVNSPVQSFRGIYMGNFAGQADNGGFAVMVRSNGTAVAVGYNTPQEEGLFISSFNVAQDGRFNASTAQAGTASGTFTFTGVSGTFRNSEGGSGTFSGNRKADIGIHAANVGYYTGTYSGQFQGSAFAILAADGTIFFYTLDDPSAPTSDGDGGGFGSINAANNLSATTVPLGLTVSGTLNARTKTISGTYRSGGATLGTFTIGRTSTP